MFFKMRPNGIFVRLIKLEIIFRSRVQFCPDFAVVRVHDFKPAFYVGAIKSTRIGDEHNLCVGWFDARDHRDRGRKVRQRRRLGIAAECDVVQAEQFVRDGVERRMLGQFTRAHHFQHCAQFFFRDPKVELYDRRRRRAVHLTVNTVEVAHLVGIGVDANRNAVRAPREDRVNELEVLKPPRMLTVSWQDVVHRDEYPRIPRIFTE